MLNLTIGDRVKHTSNSFEATVVGINITNNDTEVEVVWDHMVNYGPVSYSLMAVSNFWEKIDKIADLGKDGSLPTGISWDDTGNLKNWKSISEQNKECQHKWVDVGFNHTKTVCYHCNKEKE